MAPQYGCCDFHNPSQNLVNAFRNNAAGLPEFDTFDDVVMRNPTDFWTNSVDPRLLHTVGIATHPFKYRPAWVMQPNWRRAPQVYGYYSTMKEIVPYDDPSCKKYEAFMGGALNFDVIRCKRKLCIFFRKNWWHLKSPGSSNFSYFICVVNG